MSQLLLAINGINGRTKFSGNSLLNVDAKATEVAAKFSLQTSNQTADSISLSSNAFKNIGGAIATTSTAGTYTAIGTVTSVTSTTLTLSAATTSGVLVTDKLIFGSNSGLLSDQLSTTAGDLSLTQAVASSTNDTAEHFKWFNEQLLVTSQH
jgi:hypothetical protein